MSLDAHIRNVAFGKVSTPGETKESTASQRMLDILRKRELQAPQSNDKSGESNANARTKQDTVGITVATSEKELWDAVDAATVNNADKGEEQTQSNENELNHAVRNVQRSVSLMIDAHRFCTLETGGGENDNTSTGTRLHHSTIVIVAERAASLKQYVPAKDALELYYLSNPPHDQVSAFV